MRFRRKPIVTDEDNSPEPKPKFSYWVRTPDTNYRGECTGVSETRAGSLVIYEGSKRRRLAQGSWFECATERIR